jgi:hypothetical protein
MKNFTVHIKTKNLSGGVALDSAKSSAAAKLPIEPETALIDPVQTEM